MAKTLSFKYLNLLIIIIHLLFKNRFIIFLLIYGAVTPTNVMEFFIIIFSPQPMVAL